MLCDAPKRDANLPGDREGYTPTLVAAQNGNLDALRILVGRGGDPEKTLVDGSSALHLAAMRNHLNCVSFLVNFGVNMWALDNELHTAKDVAAIEQKKEVLDYLDQMMAKQSALSTKTVQKLKEKAKLSVEKRMKQQRKAQLKSMKKVEKDERYLTRFSTNRRLLKAAHSISDIKLVGRVGGMMDYGNDSATAAAEYKLGEKFMNSRVPTSTLSASISASSERLSSSPSVSNLMSNSKLDLLNHNRLAKHMNLLTNVSAYTSAADDSSAYSSASVSSSSGYLSSGTGSGSVALQVHTSRPKYSDLVAVNGCSGTSGPTRKIQQQNKLGSKQKSATTTEQQSLRSSSSILSGKLWGIGNGGVSRKVQLKRMLLGSASITSNNSSSTANLNEAGKNQNAQQSKSKPISLTASSTQILDCSQKDFNDNHITTHDRDSLFTTRLCNVQPSSKLRLNSNPSTNNCISIDQQQVIKWPPAPSITRAVSEPDFGSILPPDEEFEDEGQERTADYGDKFTTNIDEGSSGTELTSEHQKQATECHANKPKPTPIHNPILRVDINASNTNKQQQVMVESQQHLLTQCLSQLKLRHEAISKQQHNENEDVLLKPSKLAMSSAHLLERQQVRASSGEPASQHALYGKSDELLQLRQLNTGKFPLKPSAIKLQQQQQAHPTNAIKHMEVDKSDVSNYSTFAAGKLTTISIDSIGSAGSFAKRNCGTKPSDLKQRLTNQKFPIISSSTSSSPPASSSSSLSSTSTYAATGLVNTSSTTHSRPEMNVSEVLHQVPNRYETIEQFLSVIGLEDLGEVFAKEKIDLVALMLLTEEDLKSLNILLGPRRKLLHAIQDRRQIQQFRKHSKGHTESCLKKPMYMVVDTSL